MDPHDHAVATAQLSLQATVPSIGEVRRLVTAFAAEHGMAGPRRADLAAAVSEAVTNAVRHAYPPDRTGEVVLHAAIDGDWLTVRVTDRGCGTESTSLGLGLPLMGELAERVEYGPGPDGVGTIVLMEFPMGQDAAPRRGRFARRAEGARAHART